MVEPIIGHLKSDHALGRNFLKGIDGDKIHTLLAGIGYNFRLLLKWLRFFVPLFGDGCQRYCRKIANVFFAHSL